MKNRAAQWAIFIVSLILMGLWFPMMFFRADERWMLGENFGLDARDADGDAADGIEEAFARIGTSPRIFHDLKNVAHEWTRARPKLACKFLCFVICVLAVLAAILGVQ